MEVMHMPYPSEHAARVKDPGSCDGFKRMNQGKGVSLILCKNAEGKMEAQAYRFDKEMFTPEQAKAWLEKHNIKTMSFEKATDVKAKLSMKANKPEVDGRIWNAGKHFVYVNNEPATVYVPEETIMDTFKSIKQLIKDNGRMPIGIDHLSNDVLEENGILAKMNLLDVGDVTKVGTDGTGIYILESQLTNDKIRELNNSGDIPAYSIVGAMDAKPCPTGQADYVVNSIDVERVDFVEEGGCQVCKVGIQPNELILTSKSNLKEELNMVDEAKSEDIVEKEDEAIVEEKVEKEEEVPKEESKEDGVQEEEVKEEEEVVEVQDEPSELSDLKKELAELKNVIKDLDGKKPKVNDKAAQDAVNELIKAGKALPKMKEGLIATYNADPEAFDKLAASMPKMVTMETKAKLAKVKKEERALEEEKKEAERQKELAKRYFGVEL